MKLYISDEHSGKRFFQENLNTVDSKRVDIEIRYDPDETFQAIIGFGGAFTEAMAYTLSRVSPETRTEALRAYFDRENGLNYSFCRTHINSCDFSLENYSYCDTPGDTELTTFSIDRDKKWLIPAIKDALAIRGDGMHLFASPWSPPAWMKDTGAMNHGGRLLTEYYDTWARYFVKYLKAYLNEGINIWGITIQNEPRAVTPWDNCNYTPQEERDFVKVIGPVLHENGLGHIKIMFWDHNKWGMEERVQIMLDDPEARKYIWGVAFHWYGAKDSRGYLDNSALDFVRERYPEMRLVFSEGCNTLGSNSDYFGQWWTGEKYANHIINDLNHDTVAWTDWNMVLDERGGPNHVGNNCDAPIIADTQNDKLIYQSPYYCIGHFSRYILPGSKRIKYTATSDCLDILTCMRPDNQVVMVVLNKGEDLKSVRLHTHDGRTVYFDSLSRSISTVLI